MNAPANLHELSGIEQLRLIKEREPERRGIVRTLGLDMVEIEEGRVVFEGTPNEDVYNPLGTVHGGYAATLLDSAMGCATHSLMKPGQGYTTLELKTAYHRAMNADTGPVRAEGKVLSIGRRTAFAEGRLVDAKGRLLASGTTTLLVFSL